MRTEGNGWDIRYVEASVRLPAWADSVFDAGRAGLTDAGMDLLVSLGIPDLQYWPGGGLTGTRASLGIRTANPQELDETLGRLDAILDRYAPER